MSQCTDVGTKVLGIRKTFFFYQKFLLGSVSFVLFPDFREIDEDSSGPNSGRSM